MCRLYAMGVITTKKSLVQLEKLSTSAFCRRRLSVVMVRLKMAETLKEACTLIEQVCSLITTGLCHALRELLTLTYRSESGRLILLCCPVVYKILADMHMLLHVNVTHAGTDH